MALIYTAYYHRAVVEKDLHKIGIQEKVYIRKAIESKLMRDPVAFSKPLRRSLRGYRSMRAGDYRVVFRIEVENSRISILFIGHRSTIYDIAHNESREK